MRGSAHLHNVAVSLDGASPDGVGGRVGGDDVDRAVELSEQRRVVRRDVARERLRHLARPNCCCNGRADTASKEVGQRRIGKGRGPQGCETHELPTSVIRRTRAVTIATST